MTAAEFEAALEGLGVSQAWLAERLGVAVSSVNRWARGRTPIPPWLDFVMQLLAERQALGELREAAFKLAALAAKDPSKR